MSLITMKPVKSSQIKSVGYDDVTQTLYIEFDNGAVYAYFDVPQKKYHDMLIPTMSVGKYFYAEIKGQHGYKKLETAVVDSHIHVS